MVPVPIFLIHFKFALLGREGESVGHTGSPLFPTTGKGWYVHGVSQTVAGVPSAY